MRGWIVFSLLALAGCDDGSLFGLDGDVGRPRPDRPIDPPRDGGPRDDRGRPPRDMDRPCPEGTFRRDGRCLDRCELVAELGCLDADGDCYPVDCPAAPEEDCDDAHPLSRPGAPELCDGLDNDCDGDHDEGFTVGAECTGCGGEGKLECDVNDLEALACSTNFGQSQAPDAAALEELCDGEDNDCDGTNDEFCRFDLAPAERQHPVVCGDRVLWVEAGALVEDGSERVPAPVAFPACDGETLAWLDPGDGCALQSGVLACVRGHLWVDDADGARDVTGISVVGPPLLDEGFVYWHALVADTPVISRQPLSGGGVETLYQGVAASDPTPPVEGRMVARFWTAGEADVTVRDLETQQGSDLLGPDSAPGAPVANDAWVVWPAGAASSLWVVQRADPSSGFQLTMRDGLQRAPKLDGARLVWLDESTAPPTLRSFDLMTGVGEVIARGEIAADDFAVGPGVVSWIDAGDVFRHRWTP